MQCERMGEGLRVQRYTPSEVIEQFNTLDGEEWAQQVLHGIRLQLPRQPSMEPPGGAAEKRAVALCESVPLGELYPKWFQPFKAGQLFEESGVWKKCVLSMGRRCRIN
jgi:hypothetical protein